LQKKQQKAKQKEAKEKKKQAKTEAEKNLPGPLTTRKGKSEAYISRCPVEI
jgi:hypothetical protein